MRILPSFFRHHSRRSSSSAKTGTEASRPALTGTEIRPTQRANNVGAAAPGITADDVIAGIEMLLGRTPDAALVDYHLGLGFADRFALGKYIINTGEFQSRVSKTSRFFRSTSVFLGDRVLTSTHRGHALYLVPLDLDLTPSIIRNGEWEPHVERTIVTSLRSGDIAVDVGANVGYHTLAMAAAVGSGGQIHAFEANPELMRLLKGTMVVNGLAWVALYQDAALDRCGNATLASAPAHYGSGHVIDGVASPDHDLAYPVSVDVRAVTLDAVLA